MNYTNSRNIVYNPYAAINPRYLSEVALCWKENQLAGCTNFTPNTRINSYPSGVFHGQSGPGVRQIPLANKSRTLTPTQIGQNIALHVIENNLQDQLTNDLRGLASSESGVCTSLICEWLLTPLAEAMGESSSDLLCEGAVQGALVGIGLLCPECIPEEVLIEPIVTAICTGVGLAGEALGTCPILKQMNDGLGCSCPCE